MAQLVKCPTLEFGLGHDLTVHEIEPRVGLCAESLLRILSLSLPSPPLSSLALSKKHLNVVNSHRSWLVDTTAGRETWGDA